MESYCLPINLFESYNIPGLPFTKLFSAAAPTIILFLGMSKWTIEGNVDLPTSESIISTLSLQKYAAHENVVPRSIPNDVTDMIFNKTEFLYFKPHITSLLNNT